MKKFKILLVAKYSFLEIFKSKIMMSTLLLGMAIIVLSAVASEFTYGVPAKIALDMGLGLMTLSSVGISIFMGSALIYNEIENRTLYMVLSRDIKRWEYLLGRMLGMSLILFLSTGFLGMVALICFKLYAGVVTGLVIWSILFVLFESLITLFIVVLCSLITNKTMAVIYTLGIFITGHAMSSSLELGFVIRRPFLHKIITTFTFILPDFSRLNIKNYVLYSHSLPKDLLYNNLFYTLFYLFAMVLIVAFVFNKKDLD